MSDVHAPVILGHVTYGARFFSRNLHSRMSLVPTPEASTTSPTAPLTRSHCKLRPNTEGTRHSRVKLFNTTGGGS
jgi:hypothetical protein